MKTPRTTDIAIIGAGIIGLSTALQIARRSSLKVRVLEKGSSLGEGSSGASSAVLRHRYSLDEMVHLARDGIQAYRFWPEFTGIRKPRAEFQPDGVLWMPGDAEGWAARECERLSELGVPACVLSDTDLAERFPGLSACVLAPDTLTGKAHRCHGGGAHLLETSGGYFDPAAALEDLADACCREGVDLQMNSNVRELVFSSGEQARVTGIRFADGSSISTGEVVNCAGPWCNEFITQSGIAWPWELVPTRIQVLYLDRPEVVPGHIPVTVDIPGGLYFRLQSRGQQLVVGSTLEQDEKERVDNADEFDRFVDSDFQLTKLHALHHRIPCWPYRGRVHGYSGLYTVNRDDMHPVVGATELKGFWVANGFSGHGFKLAPAIGSMLAQQLTGQKGAFDTQVDAAFLAANRAPLQLSALNVLA